MLPQSRIMSATRLYRRIGRADESDLARIRMGFHRLFCGDAVNKMPLVD